MRDHTGPRFSIADDPAVYQAFPDVVLTASGKLLLVYRESDAHVPTWTRIMLTESADEGATWSTPREHHRLSQQEHGWTWNCPRLAQLSDGRIALICDRRDQVKERLCKWENVIWWSEDEGRAWPEPQNTGCRGYVPDRILELDDGALLLGLQHYDQSSQRLIQRVFRSTDRGATWGEPAVVASHPDYNLCEGSIMQLPSGELLCFMRENSGKGYPTFLSRSSDRGQTWSPIEPTDMIGHRPVAGLLPDGRILVTYRDVGGSWSFCAWLGDETGRGRILRIEEDASRRAGDYGYSGWVRLPDGRIFIAYHLRGDAPTSRVRGCYLSERHFD
ncbi:MAG: exo-alpha-sialidase [Armatimonadota bacterium]|nr:MAG: exo-alpha-sialidase [Armatimonadota bacterium]